jgi:hypothetical protein
MSQTIERRSGLGWDDFIIQYVKTNTPVILTDAAKGWKANEVFTPEFFKKTYPEKTANIGGVQYKLGDYVDMMLSSTEDNPAPYPFKTDIDKKFQELLPYIQPPFRILERNWLKSPLITGRVMPQASTLEIFFGGRSGWFPYIHYDLYGLYAIVTQVYGRKEFIVYEPGQEQYLYPEKEHPWKSSIDRYYEPDYEKYPLFRNARPIRDVVHPGETIFVPKGWWHTARSLEPSISIAQDLLTRYNWDVFQRDVLFYKRKQGFLRAAAYSMYMKLIGISLHLQPD